MQFPTLKDAARYCEKNHVPSMVTKVIIQDVWCYLKASALLLLFSERTVFPLTTNPNFSETYRFVCRWSGYLLATSLVLLHISHSYISSGILLLFVHLYCLYHVHYLLNENTSMILFFILLYRKGDWLILFTSCLYMYFRILILNE
jgi:hypothetical protein